MKAHAMRAGCSLPVETDDRDKWLVGFMLVVLVAMLAALSKRVNPGELIYTAGDDDIPTIVLEGP